MTTHGEEDPKNADDAEDDDLLDRLYTPQGNDPRDAAAPDGSATIESPPSSQADVGPDRWSSAGSDTEPEPRAVLGVSRRRLLQAVGVVGTAGVAGGAGTAALFGDDELFPTAFASGNFDLSLSCPPGEPCTADGGTASVDVSGIQPGDAGDASIGVVLDDNPGWLWLGGPCATGKLDDVLEVRLSLCATQDCSDGGTEIASGTLGSVLEDLASGVRVGDACLPAKEERYVHVAWRFPDDVEKPQRYSNATAGFDLEFYAQQCRHDDAPANPVPVRECDDGVKRYAISYIEVWVTQDDGCTALGKYELDDNGGVLEVGTTYPLSETYDGFDGDFAIHVTDTVENDDGEPIAVQFELLDGGAAGPTLCAVVVKGGPPALTYDDESLFESNATTELLDAPINSNGGNQ